MKHKIFYLDDERFQTRIFEKKLSTVYEVRVFNEYQEFADAIQESTPNLFVLDLYMPSVTGVEIVRYLRSTPRFQFIPIIVLTASEKEDNLRACLSAGADDFVVKPPDFDELTARIDSLIERYESNLDYARQRKIESMKLLINGFNHEFNNHLMILQGGIELIGASAKDDPTKRSLSAMLRTVERATSLLKDVTKLYSGDRMVRSTQTVDELIRIFRDQITADLEFEEVDFQIQAQSPLDVYLRMSEGNFYLVLKQIVTNALDSFYNLEDGRSPLIQVGFEKIKKLMKVTVKDNGRGIAQQNLSHVFDPFYTMKGSLGGELIRNKRHGTGLGLSLAEALVEKSGGKIHLSSIEGTGTEVTIFIPCEGASQLDARDFDPYFRMQRPNADRFNILLNYPAGKQRDELERYLMLQNCKVEAQDSILQMLDQEDFSYSLSILSTHEGVEELEKAVQYIREKKGKYFPIFILCKDSELGDYHQFAVNYNLKCVSLPVDLQVLAETMQDIQIYFGGNSY